VDLSRLDAARLSRLVDVAEPVITELELDELLERVLVLARELTGARYAAIGILDVGGETFARFITLGVDAETSRALGLLPRGEGVLGLAIHAAHPLRLVDLNRHPSSFGFPPGHPVMTSLLAAPMFVEAQAWGALYVTAEHTGAFDEADEQALSALCRWAAAAIANIRIYRFEYERRTALERKVLALEESASIGRALASETEVERMLELIAKRSRRLVAARAVHVGVIEKDSVLVAASAGEIAVDPSWARGPLRGSVTSQVAASRRTLRLAELHERTRAEIMRLTGARAGLFAPLSFKGTPLGVIAALDRVDGLDFDHEDQRLMEAFAATAAGSLATAMAIRARTQRRGRGDEGELRH
jgi:GAF domain-containing protein